MDTKSGRPRVSAAVEATRIRNNYNNRIYRAKAKQDAVEFMGGKCSHCEGVFHFSAFDFHHLDPSQKDVDPGNLIRIGGKRLYDELAKCILLCANCHRIHHYTEANVDTPESIEILPQLTLTHEGETKTLAEWALLKGAKYETFRARKSYGWSDEKIINTPVRNSRRAKDNVRLLTYSGRTNSVSGWAREVGLSQGALSMRLAKGWDVEKALVTPPRTRKFKQEY